MPFIEHFLFWFALLFAEYVLLMEFLNRVSGFHFQNKTIDKGFEGFLKFLVFIFLVQDWYVNLLLSLIFFDGPKKWNEVVTDRMKRYKAKYTQQRMLNFMERFRLNFALWLCNHLNKHDPGHC